MKVDDRKERITLRLMCAHVDPAQQPLGPRPSFFFSAFHLCSQLSSSGSYSLVVFPDIWMMHLLSIPVSLELKGLTLTATLTEAPAMLKGSTGVSRRAEDQNTHLQRQITEI